MLKLRGVILMSSKRFASSLAKQRPAFHEVFPQKKMVNRLLFELDSRLTFNKLYPVYESIYDSLNKNTDASIPNGFTGKDLMIMKKVIEKVRHKTKTINRNLLALENEILDLAAERGDNDAVSLLCFDVLKDPSHNSEEDVTHAKRLIKELYKKEHPLTIKLTADIALMNNDDAAAEQYYLKFLDLQNDTFLAGEVYGQLGQIHFRRPDLAQAEQCFLNAIKLCPIDYSVRSYFLLGQIYINNDVFKARSLIESSATQGFRESFKTLGLLEMNYFKNYPKAQEWFKLGMELYDIQCYAGYFDCAIFSNDLHLAKKCFESFAKLSENNQEVKQLFERFCEHRVEDIKRVKDYILPSSALNPLPNVDVSNSKADVSKSNTWNL